MNYYKLLEISPGASVDVIKIAYNIACEKYHNDNEKVNLLRAAYVTLTNKTTREKYDRILPCIEQNQKEQAIEKLKQEVEEKKSSRKRDWQRNCPNYYDLLGVSPTATSELITTAYRIAREKYFYDGEKMQLLLIAYETLTDDTIRKEYDMIHASNTNIPNIQNIQNIPNITANITSPYSAVPQIQAQQEVKTEESAESRKEREEQQENIRNKEFRKRYIEQERRMNQEIYYARKQLDDSRAKRMADGLREFREKEKEKEKERERNSQQLKITEEERLAVMKRREIQAIQWKEQGLCEYCGGKLTLLGKKCKSCKR